MNNTNHQYFQKLQKESTGIKKVLVEHAMLTPSPELYCQWVAKHGCNFMPFLAYTKGVDFNKLYQDHYSEIKDFRDDYIRKIDIRFPLDKLSKVWTEGAYQAMAEEISRDIGKL